MQQTKAYTSSIKILDIFFQMLTRKFSVRMKIASFSYMHNKYLTSLLGHLYEQKENCLEKRRKKIYF